jgi:NAD(P)-dependent dehydrogenase (short-subunit alcohol dehydrogenase family)
VSVTAGLQVSLEGQVAIVTGGGGGLGRAFSRALGRSGAKVVVADFNAASAEATLAALAEEGISGAAFTVDVTDEAQTAALGRFAVETFGRVDILVNNAAMMEQITQPLLEYPITLVRRTLDVNVVGPLNCIRGVVPAMRERGYGRIVNISSGGAYTASHAYGISKLGLQGLTSWLATELGGTGITINAIAPGMMKTAQGDKARAVFDADALAPSIPLKTYGEPEDLVGALLFLCSGGAAWMTGDTLRVDGGWIKSVI